MGDLVPLVAIFCLFGWMPLAAFFRYRLRLEEIRSQRANRSDAETLAAIEELRREVQALRDTTTKFDLSFDAGLSRLEGRVDRIEAGAAVGGIIAPTHQPAPTVAPQAPAAPPTPPSAWYTAPTEEAALRNGRG